MEEVQNAAIQSGAGSSRRKFLATAGVGAAVVGVAAASPSFAGTGPKTLSDPSVVVTVVDAAKGVFAINIGEREVFVTDKAFASRIASAIA